MKYKSIILLSLVAAAAFVSCGDANEPEAREVTVNGFKDRDPEGYAAYTAALRQWKASPHQIVCARLDNAPERPVSERDFLRSVPDSIDFVTMRNSAALSGSDVEDMKLVHADFGTRVLYYVTSPSDVAAAAAAVAAGQFDGVTVASPEAAEAVAARPELADAVMIFEGSPLKISAAALEAFDYILLDVSKAADDFDLEYQVRLALNSIPASRILLCTVPGGSIADAAGTVRNSIAGAAIFARDFSQPLAGIAVNDIAADYYDPDIIYKRTRGAIQLLNPAAK